jgi:UDP-N-acetylglucosamine--N-acetylmuramyl-(pentapeptide) pyrophosphoryl-undecaprenol N-acetylglucosamine transferase
MVLAALAWGVPTVILEQNMSPGLTTRYLAARVKQVHVSFPVTAERLGRSNRIRISGNPVREKILKSDRRASRRLMGLEEERSTLLVLGGSQGARGLNVLVAETLKRLPTGLAWQAVFQTGKDDQARIKEMFEATGLPVQVHAFIEEMGPAYGSADLVISRAGATTVAELTARGLPALLIPFPWAAEGHQEENAKWMGDAGAAQVLAERETAVEDLVPLLARLLTDGDRLRRMAGASSKLGRPQAAEVVAQAVWELACEREKP